MRAEWFRKTAPMSPDPIKHRKYQDEAVNAVKLLFTDVAKKYQRELAADTLKPSDAPTTPATKPLGRSDSAASFLADFCDVPDITVPSTPTVTPEAQLEEELNRYWEFEGGRGDLFDPLLWWKVRLCPYSITLFVDDLLLPRLMGIATLCYHEWLGTTLRSLLRACPWSVPSPNPVASALNFEAPFTHLR